MADRIISARAALKAALQATGSRLPWGHVTDQVCVARPCGAPWGCLPACGLCGQPGGMQDELAGGSWQAEAAAPGRRAGAGRRRCAGGQPRHQCLYQEGSAHRAGEQLGLRPGAPSPPA